MNLPISSTIITEIANNYKIDPSQLLKVSLNLSPVDHMYEPQKEGSNVHYFTVGLQASLIIEKCSGIVNKNNVEKILDFGCGYGRVLRFLINQFPKAQITGCELEEKYTDFCKEAFGVETFQSKANIKELPRDKKYDLIWAGSVFTHLSASKFEELFEYFNEVLNVDGVAVFTTHGRFSEEKLKSHGYGLSRIGKKITEYQYKTMGYGYQDYPFAKGYGVSLMKPSWFMKFIKGYENIEVVTYSEQYWDRHQDVICIRKVR
jgi:SAM-dependent methyltransferase